MHSSKLDAHLIFQCYASSMLFIHASTFVFVRTEDEHVFRLFYRWPCAVFEIRSLVLARDDVLRALVVFCGCLLIIQT